MKIKLSKDYDKLALSGWLILTSFFYAFLIAQNMYELIFALAVSVISLDAIISSDFAYKRSSFWLYVVVQTVSIVLFPINIPLFINFQFYCIYAIFIVASLVSFALFNKHIQHHRSTFKAPEDATQAII